MAMVCNDELMDGLEQTNPFHVEHELLEVYIDNPVRPRSIVTFVSECQR